MIRNLLIFSGLAALAVLSTGCDKLKSRDNLNKGVQAYKNSKFPEAVTFFQTAVQLEPTNKNTHQYLAIAYMSQYIPGADSPENVRMAENAYNEFQEVLTLDPKDETAIAYIAKLYFDQKKFDQAIGVEQEADRRQSAEQRGLLHARRDRLDPVAVAGPRGPQQDEHEAGRSRTAQR